MNISISNLAWEYPEDGDIAKLFKKHNISGIEIALTKIWDDPINASDKSIKEYKDYWLSNGVKVVAIQSLLFGHPELTIFENKKRRNETLFYLGRILHLSSLLGAEVMVFGSPKNRKINNLDFALVTEIAGDFFYRIAQLAKKHDIFFCIEPNPVDYGTDFILNTDEAIQLIEMVNHPHFRLHLDLGTLIINKEKCTSSIKKGFQYLSHFHISEPFLNPVPQNTLPHIVIANILKDLHYNKWVSIEMLTNSNKSNIKTVDKTLEFVRSIY